MIDDKKIIKKNFSKISEYYDKYAFLQNKWQDNLIFSIKSRSRILNLPSAILDIGSGTGNLCFKLSKIYPHTKILGIDIAPGMIAYSKKKKEFLKLDNIEFIEGDAENFVYQKNYFDIVVSNFVFQWIQDYNAVFNSIHQTLKPGGFLFFTTLVENTLFELKSSVNEVYKIFNKNNFPEINFYSIDFFEKLLQNNFFEKIYLEKFKETLYFQTVIDFLKWLKITGALNVFNNRENSFLIKKILFEIINTYNKNFKIDSKIPSTFEVIFCVSRSKKI